MVLVCWQANFLSFLSRHDSRMSHNIHFFTFDSFSQNDSYMMRWIYYRHYQCTRLGYDTHFEVLVFRRSCEVLDFAFQICLSPMNPCIDVFFSMYVVIHSLSCILEHKDVHSCIPSKKGNKLHVFELTTKLHLMDTMIEKSLDIMNSLKHKFLFRDQGWVIIPHYDGPLTITRIVLNYWEFSC